MEEFFARQVLKSASPDATTKSNREKIDPRHALVLTAGRECPRIAAKIVVSIFRVSPGGTPCITYTKRSLLRKVDCPALNVRPDVPRAAVLARV